MAAQKTKGEHWVTEPNAYLEPKVTKEGPSSAAPITVIAQFKAIVAKHGNEKAMALKRKVNNTIPEAWKFWTWTEYFADAQRFAKTLIHLNFKTFSCNNIIGFNSPEWFISQMGTILAGGIATGIYTSNLTEACRYISNHSKAQVICCEDNKQLAKFPNCPSFLPDCKALVVWGEPVDPATAAACKVPVYSWSDFLALGGKVEDALLDAREAEVKPGNCCCLIYTSGTTGPPKAVMISHDNITWVTKTFCENYLECSHSDRVASYLPLSHIAAQVIDIYLGICYGSCTYFCQPDALKGSLKTSLVDVKPTLFFGVPRVWEKIQESMSAIGRQSTGIKKSISTWAKAKGTEYSNNCQFGGSRAKPGCFGCANALVFSKVKALLGLDQCKWFFTGAAAIAKDTLEYFAQLDIPIYEVFGQSECTGPHTVSNRDQWIIGSCGRPCIGTETKIVPETQELTYRGRHIFMGYMYMPKMTEDTIDKDGYLHSGDVATFDKNKDARVKVGESGFMKITGRIKELIITAGGENIPPVLIEEEIKKELLAVSNVVVIGEGKKFLSCLVSLKCKDENGVPSDSLAPDSLEIAAQIGSSAKLMSEAASDPLWKKYIDEGIKKANKRATSQAQNVQKFTFFPKDISMDGGELTPTMKLKRKEIHNKYDKLINQMYEGSD